ncbi:hypothetical protein OC842_002941 [Tilletia horrida]|uniref:NADP-dependent oxidoreductase domain-containing protein n=1 Tax=Tilletia horrida TaxID=155126 RepID=A0AAN6GCC5_9BASI|nr:hypothetical protein OC842_002941 [Tilletia horrida]
MTSLIHTLGKAGETWPAVGLGLMSLAATYGKASPQEHVDKLLSTAIEQGCTFWDTADIYSKPGTLGDNERQVGAFLRSHPGAREKVFIATKFMTRYAADGSASLDGSREWCHKACEGSLEALGVDQIDLYYNHRPADNVEIEETMQALKELKEAGKIRYIGVSEFSLEQLERAEKVVHIDAYQVEISPWTPEVLKNGLFEWCNKNGTATVAYSPLGRGFLTGKFQSPDDLEEGDWRRENPRFQGENFTKNLELVRKIETVASKKGVSPAQITLAWVLSKSAHMFVIPGTTSPERLAENVGAGKVRLSKAEEAEVDQIIDSFKASGERYGDGMKTAF